MKRGIVICCGIVACAFSADASTRAKVTITPTAEDTLRFSILEATSDAHHRPATRRFDFVVPRRDIITAAEIREFRAEYKGPDGTWITHREPVAGFIVLHDAQHPRSVEFRLLEKWEFPWYIVMTINGTHRVTLNSR